MNNQTLISLTVLRVIPTKTKVGKLSKQKMNPVYYLYSPALQLIGKSTVLGHLEPTGQSSHVPLPVLVLYVPSEQFLQAVSPSPLTMIKGKQ